MNNLINSLISKYIVNLLMLIVFTGLAITGIFFMEGREGKESTSENRQEKSAAGIESSVRGERHGHSRNNMGEGFAVGRGVRDGSGEGIHQTLGVMWLFLMFLHTWQHWNWYKKLFTWKQVMQNKLLTVTTLLFVLLALSSIGLWIDAIPGGLINIKEFHGFAGQVLTGLVALHTIQRFKWYVTITQKLFAGKTVTASAI
jgi:hypothetical protein